MTLSCKRFYSTGALGNGTFRYQFYYTANTGNFIGFLISAYPEYGRFVMFLDNAEYYKSRKLKEFPKAANDEIKVCHFPACTPEPNPVKAEWKPFRKATGNLLYESIAEMCMTLRPGTTQKPPVRTTTERFAC